MEIAQSRFANSTAELSERLEATEEELERKRAETEALQEELVGRTEEMRNMRNRFEENMTRLAQQKSSNGDQAMRRRIAELEEQLSLRDEEVGVLSSAKSRRKKPRSKAAAAPTSLTKKFKL